MCYGALVCLLLFGIGINLIINKASLAETGILIDNPRASLRAKYWNLLIPGIILILKIQFAGILIYLISLYNKLFDLALFGFILLNLHTIFKKAFLKNLDIELKMIKKIDYITIENSPGFILIISSLFTSGLLSSAYFLALIDSIANIKYYLLIIIFFLGGVPHLYQFIFWISYLDRYSFNNFYMIPISSRKNHLIIPKGEVMVFLLSCILPVIWLGLSFYLYKNTPLKFPHLDGSILFDFIYSAQMFSISVATLIVLAFINVIILALR